MSVHAVQPPIPGEISRSSALQHLARVIWVGHFSYDNLFAMLATYCDASGGKDQPMMVVAGYVSTLGAWQAFHSNWKLVLAKYDIPYFHMKEFAHFRGPFEGWQAKEGTRRNLLSDLASVIHANTL